MAVAAVNLVIEKGTDFTTTFNIFASDNGPVTLSNYEGISKVRKHPTSLKSKSFDVEVIIDDPTKQSVKISMSGVDTSELTSGRNYFDVFLRDTNTGYTFKVVEGTIIVNDSASL